ncbi:MAG TPA: GIY-YIG nuclease family protein [Pseudomonadales bacterium]|nr:GIY-YIG nuclease family protein [Pseudomonadales bacterium]
MAEWVVYILRCADDTLYTGVTTQLERRVEQHNSSPRGAKYTRCRRPVFPVYSETAADRATAQRREREIKRLEKAAKEAMINEFLASRQPHLPN